MDSVLKKKPAEPALIFLLLIATGAPAAPRTCCFSRDALAPQLIVATLGLAQLANIMGQYEDIM